MAVPTMAQMIGVYVLSAAEAAAAYQKAGIRGDQLMNKLAPYEASPNTPPVATAARAGTYTLDTAAKVAAVCAGLGLRAPTVFEYMITAKAA
jgi:hypothetical protein